MEVGEVTPSCAMAVTWWFGLGVPSLLCAKAKTDKGNVPVTLLPCCGLIVSRNFGLMIRTPWRLVYTMRVS